jgi:peptidoglycan LD-endopeptidase CwlK
VEGVRSKEQMCINYGKGRTAAQCEAKGISGSFAKPGESKVTWLANPLKSRHGKQADGFGHAVDLLPAPYDWKNTADFKKVAAAMKQAATELSVNMEWGGDWLSSPDMPHFELA